jgi:hypothetical protein
VDVGSCEHVFSNSTDRGPYLRPFLPRPSAVAFWQIVDDIRAAASTLLHFFQRCSHRTLFPLAPLRPAALHSIPQRAITAVRSESSSLEGPALPRETVLALFSRTDSEFALRMSDHLHVLAPPSGVPIPHSLSETRTRRCGCADHHERQVDASNSRMVRS